MDYQARLESACRFGDRGFESHSLRHSTKMPIRNQPGLARTPGAPRVGLALSGGAARGMAHIGVLKALEEAAIPIDMISGTSAGAMVGAGFAREKRAEILEEVALGVDWKGLVRLFDLNLIFLRKGFVHGQRAKSILRSVLEK